MFTALSRIIKYGLQGFWRNGWLSTTTIAIMIIALMVFEGLTIFNVFTQQALATIQDKIDISVYFKSNTPEDDILTIKRSLESLAEVKKVEYISRAQALEIFRKKYEDNPAVKQSLEELQENPLWASLNIKAYNPKQYAVVAAYLDGSSYKDKFEKISYFQNALMIDRLSKIIDTVEQGGLLLIIFLSLVAVVVIFNTIRLAIYADREEIGIIRLVGAPNSFARGPYLVEGILYGLTAGTLSLLINLPIIYFISPYLQIFLTDLNLWKYSLSHFAGLLGYQLLFGVVLGVISSLIAVRKYLKI